MKYIRGKIDQILNHFGYYNTYVPKGDKVSEADILETLSAYTSDSVLQNFLRDLCERDEKLYFQAGNDQDRFTIRGAHMRNNYLIALSKKANKRKGLDKKN
jgi:hypothetical protein